mmetsp:Transcript_29188/g.46883  ORF Transcript_29188/g.46883 Transcript_29188/m.46883 type:complete len:145 (-) Transcript_29188:132-566(-)
MTLTRDALLICIKYSILFCLYNSGRSGLRSSSYQQQDVQIQVLATHDPESIHDRNAQIRKVEADVVELSHVFTDILDLTKEQAPSIEAIDNYVAGARTKVEDAKSELIKAEKRQAADTMKKCWFLGLLLLFLVVIFLAYHYGLL